MKAVTADEMRGIDREAIENRGIPSLQLMENAGDAVARFLSRVFPDRPFVVVAGTGNNGGDGLVCARRLAGAGFDVRVILVGDIGALSRDCGTQYISAVDAGVRVDSWKGDRGDLAPGGAVIVDAMFGTGLGRTIEGVLLEVVSAVNHAGTPVVAIDMPSGVSADTGLVLGEAVKADYTVTFGLPKIGQFLHPGATHCGKLIVENIGFPEDLLVADSLKHNLIDGAGVAPLIRKRSADSHKGTYGHVFVIAGSSGKTGAAILCARSCMRAGAGAVTLGVPDSLFHVFQARVTEEMTVSLPGSSEGTVASRAADTALEFIESRADAVVLGPGIGMTDDVRSFVKEVILRSSKPLLIDADALNSIEGSAGLLRDARCEIVVTPHPNEMRRLLRGVRPEMDAREVNSRRIEISRSFAAGHGVVCVLKGSPTIVASPEGSVFINQTGNPGMATAGSGDVLSGIIGSLMGQGATPLDASICGVHLHGLSGDYATQDKGEHSLIAGDIIEYLPFAFRSIRP